MRACPAPPTPPTPRPGPGWDAHPAEVTRGLLRKEGALSHLRAMSMCAQRHTHVHTHLLPGLVLTGMPRSHSRSHRR